MASDREFNYEIVGGFNAPSREAIYNRIHKLAYGNEWEYDYEEFTNYDAKNLTQEAVGRRKAQQSGVRIEKQHTPPVIVKKNWREAMNEPSELPNKAISNRRLAI